MSHAPFDAHNGPGGQPADEPTQPSQLHEELRAEAVEVVTPAHPPTPIAQRAVFPTPVDRGRTQPAAHSASDAANQIGYGGRFPVPIQGASGDAKTIRTGQAQPAPPFSPSDATILRPQPPGADAPVYATPTGGNASPYYAPAIVADRIAPYPNMPYQTTDAPMPPSHQQRAPLWGRWMLIGAVALLVALLAGSGLTLFSYLPTGPLRAFCADLTSQRYTDAYTLTDQRFQSLYSQQRFTRDMTTLDLAEGTATTCQESTLLEVTALPLSSSLFGVSLTRRARGTASSFTGALTVAYHGGWQIDDIATPLLGVNLNALDAADAYCAALRSQNYQRAYQLLGAAAHAGVSQQAYSATERLHNQISGSISACGVVGIGQGNTDTQASLTLGVTRSVAGGLRGAATLALVGDAWMLSAIPAQAEGPDVGPYLVGQQFCADMATSHFDDAYNLFTSQYQAANPRAQFVSVFESGRSQGLSYGCDTPNFSTYRVSGATATYVVPFIEAVSGVAFPSNDTLSFTRQSDGQWLISNSDVQLPL